MKKGILLILVFLFSGFAMQAQQRSGMIEFKKEKVTPPAPWMLARPMATCSVLNAGPENVEDFAIYLWADNNGFFTGPNAYGDKENISLFIAPEGMPYLGRVYILIGVANSNLPSGLSRVVNFKVYDLDENNIPVNVIATVSKTLGEIKDEIEENNAEVEIVFDKAVDIPANRMFGVSVDFSNLIWDYPLVMDSLGLYSWIVDEGDEFSGVKFDDDSWFPFSVLFEDDSGINLGIYPLVGDDESCLGVAPVHLSSFNAKNKSGQVEINWTTESEQNNDVFYVQRSTDGVNFSLIATIGSKAPSGNSATALHYSYVDRNPAQGTNYYRLAQKDKDGSMLYSKVQTINNTESNNLAQINLYPNPVHNALKIQFNSFVSTTATLQILDISGRNLKTETFNLRMGDNILNMNTEQLQKGNYLLKVTIPGEKSRTLKFVK